MVVEMVVAMVVAMDVETIRNYFSTILLHFIKTFHLIYKSKQFVDNLWIYNSVPLFGTVVLRVGFDGFFFERWGSHNWSQLSP